MKLLIASQSADKLVYTCTSVSPSNSMDVQGVLSNIY